jgi:hypothetical protein
MVDWTLVQSILFDDTLTKAAESAVLTSIETIEEEPQQEAEQNWPDRDSWGPADDEPQEADNAVDHPRGKGDHKGNSRNGFEPKVIGLLVHLYRFGASYNDHFLWDRVRRAADKVYFARGNVKRQVDGAMQRG